MSAFEEMWKKSGGDNKEDYETSKCVWKAALEWVLTQTVKGIEEDGSISSCDFVFTRNIKEELEQLR